VPRAVVVEDVQPQVVDQGGYDTSESDGVPGRRRRGLAAVVGIVLALAAISAGVFASHTYRYDVVKVWPPAQGIYAMFGVDVSIDRLTFRDTTFWRAVEDGTSVLVISGMVVNETGDALPYAKARATLRDSGQNELDHWDFVLGQGMLASGGSQPFETRRSSPPANAFDLELRILDAGE